MTKLMERGPVPIDRLEIGRRRRNLHEIAGRVVVGAPAADSEIEDDCLPKTRPIAFSDSPRFQRP
jgi:hypothetical protein